jgi:glycosyltransferase involved in cell wall biosynthesis
VTSLDVLFVFRDATRDTGGLTIVVRDLANGLAARGHRTRVLAVADIAGRTGGVGLRPDVGVIELAPLFGRHTGVQYGLATGAGEVVREAALVHVFSCLPVYLHFAAMAAARSAGRGLVWTPMMHPARRGIWKGSGAAGVTMRGFDAVVPRLARYVDAVCASTEAEAEEFHRLGCDRVALMPPAVGDGAPLPAADAAEFRRRRSVGGAPLVVTVASRREPRKGIAFCLAAFSRLRVTVPEAHLLLIGRADGVHELPPHVHATGRIDDEELVRAYRAADVVFVPSRYEAFSLVVIEAWQQKRPVVVTDGVGLAEHVVRGGGRVVPYGDVSAAAGALAETIRSREVAIEQGTWGRRTVEDNFVVPVVVERAEALYREVLLMRANGRRR